jgi:hypothetical protein
MRWRGEWGRRVEGTRMRTFFILVRVGKVMESYCVCEGPKGGTWMEITPVEMEA